MIIKELADTPTVMKFIHSQLVLSDLWYSQTLTLHRQGRLYDTRDLEEIP